MLVDPVVRAALSILTLACVMNIITYNAAYALFPRATFEERESLIVNRTPRSEPALTKYASRGFRLLEAPPRPSDGQSAQTHRAGPPYPPWFFVDEPRWVCDKRSWVITLDTEGVVAPPPATPSSAPLSWDPAAECGWTLRRFPDDDTGRLSMRYRTFDTSVFRWRYTAPNSEFVDAVVPFLKAQAALEYQRLGWGDGRHVRREVLVDTDAWTW